MRDDDRGNDPRQRRENDPTKVTNQPSLNTTTGRTWLVVGAITVVASVAVLWGLAKEPVTAMAVFGMITNAVLYVGMIAVYAATPRGPVRLRVIAVLFGLLVLVTLIVVTLIAVVTATDVSQSLR